MPNYQPPSNNRLLALEQELLEKKRLAKMGQGRLDMADVRKDKTIMASNGNRGTKSSELPNSCKKRHTNNRLLELEKELLKRVRGIPGVQEFKENDLSGVKAVTSPSNNRLLALEQELLGQKPQPKKQKLKSKRSWIKSQIFDTGEPIELQYNNEVFPISTPLKTAVSVPEEIWEVDKLEVEISEPELPPVAEKNEVFPISTPSKTAVSVPEEIWEVDKLEVEISEPELPPVAEKVVSELEISADITQESEKSLSEATELTPESETKFEPLEKEDILAILDELNNNQPETNPTSVSPPVEKKSDRPNPHAIFDRMGKNMAYATAFDFGTIELEKLFDEFDRTLDEEEQINQGNSVSQTQEDLELEKLFDEFDQTLEEQFRSSDISEVQELEQEFRSSDVSEVQELGESNLISTIANTAIPATDIKVENPTISPTSKLLETKFDLNTLVEFYFKMNAVFFRTGINFISLISWLVNFLRRTDIHFRPENSFKLSLSDMSDSNEQQQRRKVEVIDVNGNHVTDEISSVILSNQQSNSIVEPTSVDTLKPSQEKFTEMANHKLIRENSYSLSVAVQDFQNDHLISTSANSVIARLLPQNHNEENLNENPSHPPQNDTS
ncbi:MAG: hypothetical protein F6K23_27675 [Okeania sp. SIO2C9]|uniref:hypothetical protein n=1 Tax=Okeania sp. SIO2C9 TaxID=2607791 RepID=UPI0013C00A5D|nr:hypothetical protein [Okeania sp. SIO2C9]NEQ76481.1 hypothetical protein [Okeania sp. SIO2C9]